MATGADSGNLVGKLMEFEMGEMNEAGILALFAELIQSGLAWNLQGFYGRTADQLIQAGYITRKGELTAAGKELIAQLG